MRQCIIFTDSLPEWVCVCVGGSRGNTQARTFSSTVASEQLSVIYKSKTGSVRANSCYFSYSMYLYDTLKLTHLDFIA